MEISQLLERIEHSSRYQQQAGFCETFGIVRYIGKFIESIIRLHEEHAEKKATANKWLLMDNIISETKCLGWVQSSKVCSWIIKIKIYLYIE